MNNIQKIIIFSFVGIVFGSCNKHDITGYVPAVNDINNRTELE